MESRNMDAGTSAGKDRNLKAKGVPRDRFITSLGVLTATLGSAVGLGNIWKFPYLTGKNGGAAFLFVYVACTLLIGLPVMISEHLVGRAGRANAIKSLRTTSSSKLPWWLIGAGGTLAAFLIMAFYTEVAGWVFAYIFKSASGNLLSTDPALTSKAFSDLVSNPTISLLVQWGVLALISIITMMGVSKGIEKVTKRLLPILFGLLLLVGIRSLTLPGASEGLRFLFNPDFSKLSWSMVLVAMGLSFFKLSVGMGTMITYGSYYGDEENIPRNASRVMLADLLVSMLAGVAIFPAVFAFGFSPDAGPSLLFITIPSVFASMPLGNVFMVIFFVLTAIASIGAMLSLLEVPVALMNEELGISRKKATFVTVGLLALVGSTAALSSSVLADTTVFGLTFFDLYDYVSQNILLPAGGLFICLFMGWVWGKPRIQEALSNRGTLQNQKVISGFFVLVKYITPVLVLVLLLAGLDIIKV